MSVDGKYKPHHLYINGLKSDRRGLDLAINPFSGLVVGRVLLVPEEPITLQQFQALALQESLVYNSLLKTQAPLEEEFAESEVTEEVTITDFVRFQ